MSTEPSRLTEGIKQCEVTRKCQGATADRVPRRAYSCICV